MTTFIQGHKTKLRLYTQEDLEAILEGVNKPHLQKHVMLAGPLSRKQQQEWLELAMEPTPTNKVFAVEAQDGALLGTMGLHQIDLISGIATTGALLFNEQYLGKGYGTDAKFALLNWAFNTLPLRKITSEAKATNPRSKAYLEKNGYQCIGTFREHLLVDGEYVDVHIMELWCEVFLHKYKKYCESM